MGVSVEVVNNKVDNLDKKVDDLKKDIKEDIKSVSDQVAALAGAIEKKSQADQETYMKKADFLPYKIALGAMGTFLLAMLIFISQTLLQGALK